MRISLKARELRVAHPIHPEVVVTMRRLTNEQRMILTEQGVRTIQRALAAELGETEDAVMPEMIGSIKATLKAAITSIEGLTDDDGNAVTVTPENFDMVMDSLWGGDFLIPNIETTCVSQDGTPRDKAGKKILLSGPDGKLRPATNDERVCQLCDGTQKRQLPMQFPTWLVTKQNEAASWAKDDLDPKGQQPQ